MITFSENQQKIVDRLKTERMSQAEFEQYAKEHGYIISTTNIIEQIRAEIEQSSHGKWYVGRLDGKTEEVLLLDEVLEIIDKYTKGAEHDKE